MSDNILEVEITPLESKDDSEYDYELYKMPLKHKLFKREGRMGRLNYALFNVIFLLLLGVGFMPFIFMDMINSPDGLLIVSSILLLVFSVCLFWPNFCTSVKRLHDLGLTAWVLLLLLIPVVSTCLGLYMLFWPGEKGANRYGKATDMLSRKK